jgi:hypothetical protein
MLEHCLSNAIVGDHSILERTIGGNHVWSPPKHLFSLITNRHNSIIVNRNRHHTRLIGDNPLLWDIHKRVGGA